MAAIKTRSIRTIVLAVAASLAVSAAPAMASPVRSVDPDTAIDGDLMGGNTAVASPAPAQVPAPASPVIDRTAIPGDAEAAAQPGAAASAGNGTPVDAWSIDTIAAQQAAAPAGSTATYKKDDLIGAAEGVFGKGAQGLASMIEDVLAKQGEPNGYIVGREGGGAFIFGLRYGSGTLHHKVEGERSVYWTGPSLGIDAGLNAGNAFVLVYNLYDTQDLYHRYGAGEGQAYLVGGFNVSYLRRGDVVLIPVRMGAGLRLGANLGYMKFSEKQRWLPF